MRRFVFTVAVIFALSIAQISAVEAVDYYVGTSSATGMDCYLMTHTITELRHHSDGGHFSARLKMVGKNVKYLDYEFDIGTSGCSFENSNGYSGKVNPDDTPIEWNICRYIADNYLRR